MTLEEAIKIVDSKPINSNMKFGVYKMNDEYVIAAPSFINRFPNIKYIYIKGEE